MATKDTAQAQTAPVTGKPEPAEARPSASTAKSPSPFSQSLLGWTWAAVTIAVYCLTVAYAFGTTSLRYLSFARLSPSRSLALIRGLSELTALCIVVLIGLCTERALWMFTARRGGTSLSTFLALHYGGGLWSWIQLIYKNTKGGRLLSWLKIALTLVVPAMGVALLSEVKIGIFFDRQSPFPIAAGVGNFDPSYASDYSLVSATYLTADFSSLLQSSSVAWNVPTVEEQDSNCTRVDALATDACGIGYFLHGGLKSATPWPTRNKSTPSAPIFSIDSMRGVQLDFTSVKQGAYFQEDHCVMYANEDYAFQMCLSQSKSNAVNARVAHCSFAQYGDCARNTTWQSYTGRTMTMTAYARRANAHFSRNNLSAIAITDFSPPVEYMLSATDLLSVFNMTFNATTGLGRPTDSAQDLTRFVSISLAFSDVSSATAVQGLYSLHNLMAFPLYYFQPMLLSPFTTTPYVNSVNPKLPTNQGLYTTAHLSTFYYGLVIANWSVYIYTIVMGLLICSCLFILVLSSLPSTAGGIPDTTPWPFVDVGAECCVERSADVVDGGRASQEIGEGLSSEENNGAQLLRQIKETKGRKEQAQLMARMKVQLVRDH